MLKKLFVLLAAACVILSSCSASGDIVSQLEDKPTQEGIEFPQTPIEGDYAFDLVLEPRPDAVNNKSFTICIPTGFECDWVGDSQFDSNYSIYDAESGIKYASARVNTAPPDLAAFYGTSDEDKIHTDMISQFFAADNMHVGLRNNIVDDFGYELVVDWSGTAFGMDFFYMEFIDEGSSNHAIRFYMSNGIFDNTFYALEIRADLPMDNDELLDKFRETVYSLNEP